MKTATSGFIQKGPTTAHYVDVVPAPPKDTACNWHLVCRHDPRTRGRLRSDATTAAEVATTQGFASVAADMALLCGNVPHVWEPGDKEAA